MELQEEDRELNREDNDLEEGVEEDEEDDDVTTERKTGEAERYEEIRCMFARITSITSSRSCESLVDWRKLIMLSIRCANNPGCSKSFPTIRSTLTLLTQSYDDSLRPY